MWSSLIFETIILRFLNSNNNYQAEEIAADSSVVKHAEADVSKKVEGDEM